MFLGRELFGYHSPYNVWLTQMRSASEVYGSPRIRFLLIVLASMILFLGALRLGDLPGYDDAQFSAEAKNIVRTGVWLPLMIRGGPVVEHPPLFIWMQAAFLHLFGISDWAAKAPSALCAVGVVLLVYWLARRLSRDSLVASVAMFVMLGTPYFIKYANHAMTDVPATFFFLCAVCAWHLARTDAPWYVGAGFFTAVTLTTRGLIGFALPAAFALDLAFTRRRPSASVSAGDPRAAGSGYLVAGLTLAALPLAVWYVFFLASVPDFAVRHNFWLKQQVYGSLAPPWRRYTGLPEYFLMLVKSYWPWLPAMVAGAVLVIRERRRDLYLLLFWVATVFVLCGMARSRVLRYMLPAYPAFSILTALAITRAIRRRTLARVMDWAARLAVAVALGIVLFMRPTWHAAGIVPIARAASSPVRRPVALYDGGVLRWDEANQLEWYGECVPALIPTKEELLKLLQTRVTSDFVTDRTTYEQEISRLPHEVLFQSEHLVYARLKSGN